MSHFDDMRSLFLNLGMTEEQADIAAAGRGQTVEQARAQSTAESVGPDLSSPEALAAHLRGEDVARHLSPAQREVTEAAVAHLGYERREAAEMAQNLHRQKDYGGAGFDAAEEFCRRFAAGLRGDARVAA